MHPLKNQFLLDPNVTYLNHGSFGAVSKPVFEKYQYWQKELERNPAYFVHERLAELLDRQKELLAEYIGTRKECIVFSQNATTALNTVVKGLNLKPGNVVLSVDQIYGAIDRTWRFYAKKRGFTYRKVKVPLPVSSHRDFLNLFFSGITPETKVISLDHITSSTALIFPVKEICREARKRGIITVIDGAHAVGQLPLKLDELGADYYAGNLHKWLCAPRGAAFLYARDDLLDKLEPLIISWGWPKGEKEDFPFAGHHEWLGTKDYSAFLSVSEAINFQKQNNWHGVVKKCHALASKARAEINSITGLEPLQPEGAEWYGQMVSFLLPRQIKSKDLQKTLSRDHGIEILGTALGEQPLLRVSFQGYNSKNDLETLLTVLAETKCIKKKD